MADFHDSELTHIVTLDMAEDAFEANPNAATALELLETAEGYENDGMIEADELHAIQAKVAARFTA